MMNRKKSIFLSLVVVGVAATMITAATMAVFTDQVVSTNNELDAGTILLSVDNTCGLTPDTDARTTGSGGTGGGTGCPSTFTWTETVSNMKIGDTASHTFNIENDGTLAGTLSATPAVSVESPADCFHVTTQTLADTSLDASNGTAGSGGDFTTFQLVVTLDAVGAANDNACQDATATIEVTFNLVQA
jgi:predicted ribosomally synthesized peptide with SipW-like signal peptide